MSKVKEKAWRNDAYAKVTGKAKYADDIKFPFMLHAVPVYTDSVHAEILTINTKEAETSEGVAKVITAADVPGKIKFGQINEDYSMFATDKIRMNGDVVAIVVAETRNQAIEASKKVTVELKELKPILDVVEAMKPASPLVHDDQSTNIVNHHKIRRGHPDKGFATSDIILEEDFETQHIEHAYMEPESAVCRVGENGVLEIYGSVQHPFTTRRFVSALLGIPLADVDVIGIPSGGGFGGKDDTASIVCARTALAAKLCSRPVKMTYDREWSIRESYKRHPYKMHYKMGLTNSGEIQAVECKLIADSGPYTSVTPFVTWRSTVQCCGPYNVDHVKCDTFGVYTNNVYTGAMRGFGSPQVNFAIEQLVEMAAEKVNMTATEFRRKNMLRQGDTTVTDQVLEGHTVSLEQVFDTVLDRFSYENKLAKSSYGNSEGDELYGVGMAMSYRGMSLGAEGMDFCSAIINVQFDGSVLLQVGVHENGQGAEAAMILILAEELGISRDKIRYHQLSTSDIPDGGPTVASRATIMGGGAVTIAANHLKEHIYETLKDVFDCPFETLRFENNTIIYGDSDKIMSFEDMLQLMWKKQTYPYAFGTFQAPKVSWDEDKGKGNAYFTWVYGCQAVELTVNKKTGKVKLLNAIAAHDVGKAVNTAMLEGQFFGGMAMGMGYALKEYINSQDGKIRHQNFNKYQLMRSGDMPDMEAIIIENHDPLSPSKAKGIGEPTNEIMSPAIANAIYHATGKRYKKSPITIEI